MRLLIPSTLFSLFLACSSLTHAESCESVLALSKQRSTIVKDDQTVLIHARNFCKEYAKSSGSLKSSSFGASYKFLSASFGKNGASKENVASTYCSAKNTTLESQYAYQEYIENIAPGAYSAYAQCVKMNKQNVRFYIDQASILPTEFTLHVSFVSTSKTVLSADLEFSSSDGIDCSWSNSKNNTFSLPHGSTTPLQCKRDNYTDEGYVSIANTSGIETPLTLPWPKYTPDGYPLQLIKKIQERIDDIENELALAGRSVVIKGTTNAKNLGVFSVSNLFQNNLVKSAPKSSAIKLPFSGTYVASSITRACNSGVNSYLNSQVKLNGDVLASATNRADECGAATATTTFSGKQGDTVSGLCSINQGVNAACWMSLSLTNIQ